MGWAKASSSAGGDEVNTQLNQTVVRLLEAQPTNASRVVRRHQDAAPANETFEALSTCATVCGFGSVDAGRVRGCVGFRVTTSIVKMRGYAMLQAKCVSMTDGKWPFEGAMAGTHSLSIGNACYHDNQYESRSTRECPGSNPVITRALASIYKSSLASGARVPLRTARGLACESSGLVEPVQIRDGGGSSARCYPGT